MNKKEAIILSVLFVTILSIFLYSVSIRKDEEKANKILEQIIDEQMYQTIEETQEESMSEQSVTQIANVSESQKIQQGTEQNNVETIFSARTEQIKDVNKPEIPEGMEGYYDSSGNLVLIHHPGELQITNSPSGGSVAVRCQECDYAVGTGFLLWYEPVQGTAFAGNIDNGEFYCFVDGDYYPIARDENGDCYCNGTFVGHYDGFAMSTDFYVYLRNDFIDDVHVPGISALGPITTCTHDTDAWTVAKQQTKR